MPAAICRQSNAHRKMNPRITTLMRAVTTDRPERPEEIKTSDFV